MLVGFENLQTMSWARKTDTQDPGMGFGEDAESLHGRSKPWPENGPRRGLPRSIANGGPYDPERLTPLNPPGWKSVLLGMQGLGKPGRHQLSVHEWGLFGEGTFLEAGDETCPEPWSPMVWPDVACR